MKRFFKRLLGLGALAAMGYAVWRAYDRRRVDTGVTWDPQPFPFPPQPRAEPAPSVNYRDVVSWVDADGGTCPISHPVKVKLASGIYHQPGGTSYTRTNADRCYLSAEAATADGFRPAKR